MTKQASINRVIERLPEVVFDVTYLFLISSVMASHFSVLSKRKIDALFQNAALACHRPFDSLNCSSEM